MIFLNNCIAPALDLMTCLQTQDTRDCNKGMMQRKNITLPLEAHKDAPV